MITKAMITTPKKDLALYMGANETCDLVEGFLEYAKLQGANPLTESIGDGWSVLSQVVSNYERFAGDITYAVAPYSDEAKLSKDGSGVYVVDENWKIADREFPDVHDPIDDRGVWTVYEIMSKVNENFPSVQRINDERLREASKAFYSELTDGDLLKRRAMRKAAAFDLQNHFWRDFADKQEVMAKFDECPGIAEKLSSMGFEDTDELATPETKVQELYTKLYPTDDLGLEIGEDLTVEDLARWVDADEPYLDDIISDEPHMAERVLDFVADAYGIPYEDIYDRWDWGKACSALRDAISQGDAVRNVQNAISTVQTSGKETGYSFSE